jgi:hypothetical protein
MFTKILRNNKRMEKNMPTLRDIAFCICLLPKYNVEEDALIDE